MADLTGGGTYMGWYWILWGGFIFLVFLGLGNWGYSHSAHPKFDGGPKSATDILDERYAKGEIDHAQYH